MFTGIDVSFNAKKVVESQAIFSDEAGQAVFFYPGAKQMWEPYILISEQYF